jgi:hypothetical protein
VVERPRLTLTVDHIIEPVDDGALLTERWIMSRSLGSLVALLLGWRLRSPPVAATTHLARLAETRAPT